MNKIFSFTYGIIAYIVFLASFLYSIGFVGNIIVPKAIDTGVETSFLQSILINILLLSVFAIQHSVMARPAFKAWFTQYISPAIERSTYILLTSLALFLIFWKWQPLTGIIWDIEQETIASILTGTYFLGWVIVLLSTFMISHFELFGLLQIYNNLKNRKTRNSKFQTNYFYKIVRHPLMLGFLIAFWATPVMTVGHLLFTAVTSLYILIAVKYLEEKDLREAIGKEYEDYQNQVPMLIPFTKFGRK